MWCKSTLYLSNRELLCKSGDESGKVRHLLRQDAGLKWKDFDGERILWCYSGGRGSPEEASDGGTADMLTGRMTMDQGTASKGQSFLIGISLRWVFVETSVRYVLYYGTAPQANPVGRSSCLRRDWLRLSSQSQTRQFYYSPL